MKTLDELKNEVAKENGFETWGWFKTSPADEIRMWPEVCRRYALECCQATLAKASEKAETYFASTPCDFCKGTGIRNGVQSGLTKCPHCDDDGNELVLMINKSTITDKENIVIL